MRAQPIPCGVDMMPALADSASATEPDPLRIWIGNLVHGINQTRLLQVLAEGGVQGNNDTTVEALSCLGNL